MNDRKSLLCPVFVDLVADAAFRQRAATILRDAFLDLDNETWKDAADAEREVDECAAPGNICVGLLDGEDLVGWAGLRPMYALTWELHPLVVATSSQASGAGRALLAEIERRARERGIIGIALGTDDEHFRTSLSEVDLDPSNLFGEIARIRNTGRHPYAFYERCGYTIVGVIPDANGKRKPDIWMWKRMRE